MVAIPDLKDPTLEAMKAAIKAAQDTRRRDYLGASLIGNECARQIWYEYNGFERPPFEAETLMNFEDGHRTEDLTAARLRMVPGIELWTHDENGEQFGFKALGGKFSGHCDGVIRGLKQATKALHIWEAKCSAQKKFSEFQNCKAKFGEKLALKNWNQNYFAQAQLYMHYLNIDRHYMTVALAGGRDYDSCRTEYQPEVAQFYIDRADSIISAREPPSRINEKPDFFLCRFCNFKEICRNAKNTTTISRSVSQKPF
jgi:hypothetical protein